MRAMSSASNASRESKALCGTTAVAMPRLWPVPAPGRPARLLMTAATCTPHLLRQSSFSAARAMAAMLEPLPEIRMTMFFCALAIAL
jgi:hypothetical protein